MEQGSVLRVTRLFGRLRCTERFHAPSAPVCSDCIGGRGIRPEWSDGMQCVAHVRIGRKMYDASDSGLRFAAGGFSGTGTGLAQRRRLRFVVPEACRAIARLSGECDPTLVSDYARRLLPDCWSPGPLRKTNAVGATVRRHSSLIRSSPVVRFNRCGP